MTRSLAVELAHGACERARAGSRTEDGEPVYEGQRQMVEATVPFGRMGRADELAGAAVYLASPAASYTSGAVITCNGASALVGRRAGEFESGGANRTTRDNCHTLMRCSVHG